MDTSAKKIKQKTNLLLDILPKKTARALKACANMPVFSREDWYLAGGTALALQVGNRQSVDLDFFTRRREFNEKKIEEMFSAEGKWLTTAIDKGTLYGEFFGGKISFISYPFFKPSRPMLTFGHISLLTPPDIAVMKLVAISQRGRKRDFFDLFWICRNIQPLNVIISNVNEQYTVRQNPAHILKSLVYFEDAESDPNPKIYFRASWKEVKKYFQKEVPEIAKRIINL
jgi:predicted nucleotidyltransferase component of viral defense system